MILKQGLALAEKELLLGLRFKMRFFLNFFVNPLIFSFLFIIVYNFLFSQSGFSSDALNSANFIPFVLVGSLAYTYLNVGYSAFNSIFLAEKFWQTALGMLFVTKDNLSLIIAGTITSLVTIIIPTALILGISFFIFPTTIFTIAFVLLVLLLVLVISLSFGLVFGCFSLSNENFIPLFNYFRYGWVFLSCIYYPIEALPKIIHPLVEINPIYQAIFFIRGLWFSGNIAFYSFFFVLGFAIVAPFVAKFVFDRVFGKYGISGY